MITLTIAGQSVTLDEREALSLCATAATPTTTLH